MAQIDGLKIPTGERTLSGGNDEHGRCQSPMSPSFGKSYDHEEDQNHHVKKSVLARVKDKAKKWRQTLIKKKHGHDGGNTTPAWGVNLEEDDDEEDPEYHGAPMYESEMAPDGYKETAMQHNTTPPIVAEKHVLEPKAVREEQTQKNGGKTLTETVTDILVPAYTMVSEATHMIAGKIQGPPVATTATTKPNTINEQVYDKGVSVKEYLMQKLEPGEEERALSQVISEVMSPKSSGTGGEIGVVEKVKEAVSSLLSAPTPAPAKAPPPALVPALSLAPALSPPSPVPVSTNPHAEIVEETHGRILQTN
ncbi:uncharacterized protein LOC143878495 [Tasmannia lanceolata]|uniref:uncharacterized protein LOC143878495 n=1 Tax=Tasmannia lanceolata TaxID=3420 RepID=UPI00406340D0